MFSSSWTSLFGSNKQQPVPPTLPSSDKEKPKKPPVYVYVWDTSFEDVGHAAIQVDGDEPKYKVTDPGSYVSIWPAFIPSYGPTKAIPLRAAACLGLGKDSNAEAESHIHHHHAADHFGEDQKKGPKPRLAPDFVFKMKGLNSDAMMKEIKSIQTGIENGTVRYQLFPNVHLFNWANKLSTLSTSVIMSDPFSGELNHSVAKDLGKKSRTLPAVYNCTTLVQHIIQAGGGVFSPVATSKMKPWGITPGGLAKELEKMDVEKLELSPDERKFKRK